MSKKEGYITTYDVNNPQHLILFHSIIWGIQSGLSYRKMAGYIGKSIGSVQKLVKKLIDLGYVEVAPKKRGQKNGLRVTEKGRKFYG